MPLTLEIVTPEARVYSESVDTVVIPTVEGEIGILPGHIPLVAQVGAGELRATKGGVTQLLIVGGGFAQVTGEKVSILAERAIEENKIDENAVADAMKRAEDALRTKESLGAAEIERLEGVVRFSVAQLGVRRRRHQ
jgi:F-type H+-transporting ATPase subunit epsilon